MQGTTPETGPLEPYIWDADAHSEYIKVMKTPDTVYRRVAKSSTDGARGSLGFREGRHIFVLQFNDKPWGSHCGVGVCTKEAALQGEGYVDLLGQDEHSWAVDLPSKRLLHKGQMAGWIGRKSDVVPKRITMVLDMEDGTLAFGLKGDEEEPVVAFRRLKEQAQELYPAVSLVYGRTKVTISHSLSSDLNSTFSLDYSQQAAVLEASQGEASDVGGVPAQGSSEAAPEPASERTQSEGTEINGEGGMTENGTQEEEEGEEEEEAEEEEEEEEEKEEPQQEEERKTDDKDVSEEKFGRLTASDAVLQEEASPAMEQEETEDPDTVIRESGATSGQQASASATEDTEAAEQQTTQSMETTEAGVDDPVSPDDETGDTKVVVQSASDSSSSSDTDGETEDGEGPKSMVVLVDKPGEEDQSVYTIESQRQTGPPPSSTSAANGIQRKARILKTRSREERDVVEELGEADCYLLQLAHAWDFTKRGSALHPYPNMPCICLPSLSFGERVQGLRGRQGFQVGTHRWRVRELAISSPGCRSTEDMYKEDCRSNVLVGVVSEQHRLFNFGFHLNDLGQHVWCWQPSSHTLWHSKDCSAEYPEGAGEEESYDLTEGVDVVLDISEKTLSFEYKGQLLGEAFTELEGDEFYPFILYLNRAVFPVELKYLNGPRDYIEDMLDELRQLPSRDLFEELISFRSLHQQPSLNNQLKQLPERKRATFYSWGSHSRGFFKKWDLASLYVRDDCPPPGLHDVSLATVPLSGGRHVIDIVLPSLAPEDHYVLGVVSSRVNLKNFEYKPAVREDEINHLKSTRAHTILGDDLQSWGWDMKERKVYHGGKVLLPYPPNPTSFDFTRFNTYRLTVDFSPRDNSVSIASLNTEGKKVEDYGAVFVNLPDTVIPAIGVVRSRAKSRATVDVQMNYIAGPADFVDNLVSSRACTIL